MTLAILFTKNDMPVRSRVSKSVISSIAYGDGHTDTFFTFDGKEISPSSPLLQQPDELLNEQGYKDARKYYTRYHGASTGTLLATFPGSPLLGLIVGGTCTIVAPKEKNLGIPNAALAKNEAYHSGYARKAGRMKRGKIWGGFAIGVLINAALFAAIGSGN